MDYYVKKEDSIERRGRMDYYVKKEGVRGNLGSPDPCLLHWELD
jgi:hypothetical protein